MRRILSGIRHENFYGNASYRPSQLYFRPSASRDRSTDATSIVMPSLSLDYLLAKTQLSVYLRRLFPRRPSYPIRAVQPYTPPATLLTWRFCRCTEDTSCRRWPVVSLLPRWIFSCRTLSMFYWLFPILSFGFRCWVRIFLNPQTRRLVRRRTAVRVVLMRSAASAEKIVARVRVAQAGAGPASRDDSHAAAARRWLPFGAHTCGPCGAEFVGRLATLPNFTSAT